MKPINSPARTLTLVGLSIALHSALFWNFSESLSLKDSYLKVREQIFGAVDLTQNQEAVEVLPQEEVLADIKPSENFEFHKVESVVKEVDVKSSKKDSKTSSKKVLAQKNVKPKKEESKNIVGAALPEKSKTTSDSSEEISLPKNKVTLVPTETEKSQTEAQAEVTKTPSELAEVQNLDLLSEVEQSEPMRSYLGLSQAPGNKGPRYPKEALTQGHQGRVILNYFVNEDGGVQEIQVAESSGYDELDNEAIRAISNFRYLPGQSGWTEHPVKFTLKNNIPDDLEAAHSSTME
ncbi:MAG TPA: hypothetical protein DCL41_01980 [Bdellovibrionales bacterium]|nr:hypothetical protein [Bdellovibrionales bacterium]